MAVASSPPSPTATTPPARRRRPSPVRRRETLAAYLFLSPWIVGFLLFTGGAMVASVVLSVTDYDALSAPSFVGADNYVQLLEDPKVSRAMMNTVVYTVLHVPLAMGFALGLAMLLHRAARLRGFFRTVFYLPSMTPAVAVGVLFLLLLNGETGLLNRTLELVGLPGPGWTTDAAWILPGIVVMSLWSVGGTMVIYLAALQNVPSELYEAASLDGAGPWRQFRSVTVPVISGALFFTLITNTIASLQMFTEVYTMYFGSQQSELAASDAALLYLIYIFQQAFAYLNMGYASALAWLLFVVILLITLVQVKVANRFVYYEGGE